MFSTCYCVAISMETISNARAWPQQCWESLQTDPTLLRYASVITEQKKCWELLAETFDQLNFTQRLPTTRNNMHQATCKRTRHLTSNNVSSVFTGPKCEDRFSISTITRTSKYIHLFRTKYFETQNETKINGVKFTQAK